MVQQVLGDSMTNEDLADQFEDSKVKGSKVKGSKVKLAALAIIDRELQRLHVALNRVTEILIQLKIKLAVFTMS
jgi:hypothetical protein